MFWIGIILSLVSVVQCFNIGEIENHIMINGIVNSSLSNQTKDQCICQMIRSDDFIFAANYFQINQTCQLFNYNTNLMLIELNFNSYFIFINQSSMLITTIQTNKPIMSTTSSSSSTTTKTSSSSSSSTSSSSPSTTSTSSSTSSSSSSTTSSSTTSSSTTSSSSSTTSTTTVYPNTTYSYGENSVVNLTCANPMRLTIVNAFYGAIACVNCSCSYCQCANMNVTSTIATQCANLSSCTFISGNGLFGDPCPSHVKTFMIAYYCS